MTSVRARAPRALAFFSTTALTTLTVAGGCAQIITRSTVEVTPRTETTPLAIPPGVRSRAAAPKPTGPKTATASPCACRRAAPATPCATCPW